MLNRIRKGKRIDILNLKDFFFIFLQNERKTMQKLSIVTDDNLLNAFHFTFPKEKKIFYDFYWWLIENKEDTKLFHKIK